MDGDAQLIEERGRRREMLHRMALRVLPSLSLAVTEDTVRKQKRWVMLVPGLVAFGIYRLAKHLMPLTDPVVLLLVSGMTGLLTALLAYRVGRAAQWGQVLREDGRRLLTWMAGWIGFVYAVQLSLLVLALLWLVGYDYAKHPDGPAMMALVIPSTAVARDAFEIGYVRWLEVSGRPFVTFPDGAALRVLLQRVAPALAGWIAAGALGCASLSLLAATAVSGDLAVLVQGALVTLAAGTVGLLAFFAGQGHGESWVARLTEPRWG